MSDLEKVKSAIFDEMRSVLLAYEQWEADFIENGNWDWDFGALTPELYDRLMEIQGMRNAVLAKSKKVAETLP